MTAAMKFIDAHTHTFLRGPEDLERMGNAGTVCAVVCAFLPVQPTCAGTLLDLFAWLDTVERERLEKRGIREILAVGIHPRCIPPAPDTAPVIERVKAMLQSGRAGAVGEIGLEKGTDAERGILLEQLRLAAELSVPAVVHTPRTNKEAMVQETLRIIDESGIADELVILDHLTPAIVRALDAKGRTFRMGLTLQPGKTTPEEVKALLDERGPERLHLDSDLSHMPSQPDAVAEAARRLAELGAQRGDIEKLTFSNAASALRAAL